MTVGSWILLSVRCFSVLNILLLLWTNYKRHKDLVYTYRPWLEFCVSLLKSQPIKQAKGLFTLHTKLQKKQLSSIHTIIFFTAATIFQQFYIWTMFSKMIFLEKSLQYVCSVRGPMGLFLHCMHVKGWDCDVLLGCKWFSAIIVQIHSVWGDWGDTGPNSELKICIFQLQSQQSWYWLYVWTVNMGVSMRKLRNKLIIPKS